MTVLADITTTRLSGLTHIDALLDGGPGWNFLTPARNVLNYTFSVAQGAESGNASISGGLTAFNAAQQSACLSQLAYISQLTGIVFNAVSDGSAADLHFANTNIVSSASTSGLCSWEYGYSLNASNVVTSYTADAYVYLDNVEWSSANTTPNTGSSGYETLLHELGHALGLKHPFEGSTALPSAQDNTANTLMSYTHSGGPYSTFSPYDIAALMWLYGGDGLGGALGSSSAGAYIIGSAGADSISGTSGNDKLQGLAGNDSLNGGGGTDAALFSGNRSTYTLARTASGFTVAAQGASDGTDTLTNIERLQFADSKLAVDTSVSGSAGKAALLIGAVLGKASLTNQSLVGELLTYFDAGTTLHDAATVLVNTHIMDTLAGGSGTDAFVNLIYQAIIGQAASPATTAELAAYINNGTYSKIDFLAVATELPVNQTNVDLVGLQQTGIAFL